MIALADTSPINYLVQLGHIHLLREMYGHVVVPYAVLAELQHEEAPPDVRRGPRMYQNGSRFVPHRKQMLLSRPNLAQAKLK